MTSTTVSPDIVSFFVCSIEKHIVCCISAKKNYYNLAKNSHKFRASVIEMCTSVSKSSGVFWQNSSKPPVKKLNLEKNFTAHELVHKWFLRFLVSFFSHIYRSLSVLHTTDIFCIRIIFVKGIFPTFIIPEVESERKKVFVFELHLPAARFDQFI